MVPRGKRELKGETRPKKGIKEESLEVFTFSHSILLKLFLEEYGLHFYSHGLLSLDADLACQSGVRKSSRTR
jgi:hypothetical protein